MDNSIKIINFNFCNKKIKKPLSVDFHITKNNVLTFNNKKEHYQAGNELYLIDYSGAIGIPGSIAINIPYENKTINISGIIASPANILCLGALELIIKPESNLELLIQSDELLVVDGKHIDDNNDKDSECEYCYGNRLFTDIQKEYLRKTIDGMSPPKILNMPTTFNANFKNSRINNVRDIDICIKERIVNIMKFGGVTNIFYNNVDYKIVGSDKKKSNSINSVDSLRRNLENALKNEEFENAAKIRDEIKRRETKIYYSKTNKNNTSV